MRRQPIRGRSGLKGLCVIDHSCCNLSGLSVLSGVSRCARAFRHHWELVSLVTCGTCATCAGWNIVTAETGKRTSSCHWGMGVTAAVNSAGRGLDRPWLSVPRGSFPSCPCRRLDVFLGADEATSHPQGVGHSVLVVNVCIWCSRVQHPGVLREELCSETCQQMQC